MGSPGRDSSRGASWRYSRSSTWPSEGDRSFFFYSIKHHVTYRSSPPCFSATDCSSGAEPSFGIEEKASTYSDSHCRQCKPADCCQLEGASPTQDSLSLMAAPRKLQMNLQIQGGPYDVRLPCMASTCTADRVNQLCPTSHLPADKIGQVAGLLNSRGGAGGV